MNLGTLAAAWERDRVAARRDARVLVIDPDSASGMTLSAILGSASVGCDTASSLADARALLGARPYSLLIIAEQLRDGSGIRLIEELASGAEPLPAIVSADTPSASGVVDALAAGAFDYLPKPFRQHDDLSRRIVRILEGRLARQVADRCVADLTKALWEEHLEAPAQAQLASIASKLFSFRRELDARVKVLVVEDNATLAQLLVEALDRVGLKSAVAHHPKDAEGWLERPDGPLAAILSVEQTQGLSLMRTLHRFDSRLELIVSSGAADTALALAAVEAGASDYLIRSNERVEILGQRALRAVARGRRRHLHQHLLTTLFRVAGAARLELNTALLHAGDASSAEALAHAVEQLPPSAAESAANPEALAELFAGASDALVDRPIERGARPRLRVQRQEETQESSSGAPTRPLDPSLIPVEIEVAAPNRRRESRLQTRLEIRFQAAGVADLVYGHLKDVSAGGLFIPMDRPLPEGTRLKLELLPGWDQDQIQLVGEVVRSVPQAAGIQSGIGVHLIAGQQALVALLEKTISDSASDASNSGSRTP